MYAFRLDRPGKDIALHERTAERLDDGEFGLSFDALHDRVQAHFTAERQQRADDVVAHVVVLNVSDEAAVDLELGERERVKRGEARLAGAEIVERNAAADLSQHLDGFARPAGVMNDRGFGDFQIEPVRIEAAIDDDGDDAERGFGTVDVLGGEIEGQSNVPRPCLRSG